MIDHSNTNIISIVLLTISTLPYFFLKKLIAKIKLITETETSSISRVHTGLYEINGKAKVYEKTLISPISQKECLYFDIDVMKEVQNKNSKSWRSIYKEKSTSYFALEDQTGKAIINPQNANFDLSEDLDNTVGFFDALPSHIEDYLKEKGSSYFDLFKYRRFKYTECIIETGDELFAIGEVTDLDPNHFPIFSSTERKLILTDKTEEELINKYKWQKIALISLITLLLGASAYLAFLI